MAVQLDLDRVLDASGDPVSGAKCNVYQTGTTTPVTVYTDTALSVAHANPIVADSEGRFAQAFYSGTPVLKLVITDASDVELETFDPAPTGGTGTSAASDVSFTPTTGNPNTNVQDAIAALDNKFELIESFNFADTASKVFSGFDAASYDWYEFVFLNVVPATDGADLRFRTSTDGGSTIDVSSGDYFTATSPGAMSSGTAVILASSVGSDTGEWGFSGRLRLYGPHIAAKTQMTFEGTFQNAAGAYQAVSGSGVRTAVADVDAVQISFSTGNLESGTCIMFGGRNA